MTIQTRDLIMFMATFLWLIGSMILLVRDAGAADEICINPPDIDQTIWQGKDGTLSYCTSNVPSGYDVSFDGIIDPAGSVPITGEVSMRVEFSVAGRVGEASFLIHPSNPTVPEVAGTAIFPDPVPPRILP